MFTPLFITLGILGALYMTRGTVRALWPGRWYLVGAPQQIPGAPPATREEIEAQRLFLTGLGFADVKYDRSTLEDGRRFYWFKGRWRLAAQDLSNAGSVTRVYETLF